MPDPNMITISLEEYLFLKDTEAFMTALHRVGVDNWDGYDYAMELYRDNND